MGNSFVWSTTEDRASFKKQVPHLFPALKGWLTVMMEFSKGRGLYSSAHGLGSASWVKHQVLWDLCLQKILSWKTKAFPLHFFFCAYKLLISVSKVSSLDVKLKSWLLWITNIWTYLGENITWILPYEEFSNFFKQNLPTHVTYFSQ